MSTLQTTPEALMGGHQVLEFIMELPDLAISPPLGRHLAHHRMPFNSLSHCMALKLEVELYRCEHQPRSHLFELPHPLLPTSRAVER
jgi:hypothetical protein